MGEWKAKIHSEMVLEKIWAKWKAKVHVALARERNAKELDSTAREGLQFPNEMVICSADAQSAVRLWQWLVCCLHVFRWEPEQLIIWQGEVFDKMGAMNLNLQDVRRALESFLSHMLELNCSSLNDQVGNISIVMGYRFQQSLSYLQPLNFIPNFRIILLEYSRAGVPLLIAVISQEIMLTNYGIKEVNSGRAYADGSNDCLQVKSESYWRYSSARTVLLYAWDIHSVVRIICQDWLLIHVHERALAMSIVRPITEYTQLTTDSHFLVSSSFEGTFAVVETLRMGQQVQDVAVFIIQQPITRIQLVYLQTSDHAALLNASCFAPNCTNFAHLVYLVQSAMLCTLIRAVFSYHAWSDSNRLDYFFSPYCSLANVIVMLQVYPFLHDLGLQKHIHLLDYLFMTCILHTISLFMTTLRMVDVPRGTPCLIAVLVRHFPCPCQPRRSFVDEVMDSVKGNSQLSFMRYSYAPVVSSDHIVFSVTNMHLVFQYIGEHVHKDILFLVASSSVFYPSFDTLVRQMLLLSSIVAVHSLQLVLGSVSREDDNCLLGILGLPSIIHMVSLRSKQQGLAIRYGFFWNGNCSHVSCLVSSPEFMHTRFIEIGFVAIDFGDVAWIPQLYFSLPNPNRETLRDFSNMQHLYCRQPKDLLMQNGTILSAVNTIIHSTAKQSTIDEYMVQVFARVISSRGCSTERNEHKADCRVILPLLYKHVFDMASLRTLVLHVSVVSVSLGDSARRTATVVICMVTTPCFAELVMGASTTLVLCVQYATRHTLYVPTQKTAQVLLFHASGDGYLLLHVDIITTTSTYKLFPHIPEEKMIEADVMNKAVQEMQMVYVEVSRAEFLILNQLRPEDMPYSKGEGC